MDPEAIASVAVVGAVLLPLLNGSNSDTSVRDVGVWEPEGVDSGRCLDGGLGGGAEGVSG